MERAGPGSIVGYLLAGFRWWMVPVLVGLAALAALLIWLASASAIAPTRYGVL